MASAGNPNQLPAGGPFDVPKLFNPPSSPPPTTTAFQNPNKLYPPSPASASYPPPTVTGGGPYSYPPQTQMNPNNHQFNIPPPPLSVNHFPPSNLHHQRSVPYPTHPLQLPSPNHNPNTTHGARLMGLLSAPPPSTIDIPPATAPVQAQNPMLLSSVPVLHPGGAPTSNKLPTGRFMNGDRVVYDIDVRLPGELQPQLEVTPITKYGSDPGLVVGRQIAVNKSYICYGLKQGAIRVLNINTALRSLLKGLAQRVTDMTFFAEDVHLLASASIDGRVYVWKITESQDEDAKTQITGKIVIAVQIVGEDESVHPRVCWHCHKQEVLVVGIGKHILKIDTTKVGRGEVYSADEPLKCHVDKLINGIQLVGNHDGEVTDLSMCQWMTTRLVSASVDGTIKIWEDRKSSPIAVLRPHDGQPVNSAIFLTAPHRPDHIILITGGPFNREIKIWSSESEEGWLLPSDVDLWHCSQTLELKSSTEPKPEDSFFNQVVVLSQSGLILLANAKKNTIYAVHLEYGPNPESTRMDYISEFTVTMPILSLTGVTGTSDLLPHGEIIQIYCVQTQAIQQYALDLSRCLPPLNDGVLYDKPDSVKSDVLSVVSPTVSLSPKLSRKPSNYRTTSGGFESSSTQTNEYAVDRQIATALSNLSNLSSFSNFSNNSSLEDNDSKNEDNKAVKDDNNNNNTVKFNYPTHLVTPAELMAMSASEQDVVVSSDLQNALQNADVDVKIVGETGLSQTQSQSQNGDLIVKGTGESKVIVQILDSRDGIENVGPAQVKSPVSGAKGKKQKGKNGHGSGPPSPFLSVYNNNSTNSSTSEPGGILSNPSAEAILLQIQSMQETISQVLINQKEIEKQIPALITVPITKEGRRIEAAIGKSMEKTNKSNFDAYWGQTLEEFSKQEKSNRDHHQQISGLVTNGYKELLATFERMLKKEISAIVPAVIRSVTPVIEKTVSAALSEAFQRGVGDKAINQLEKSVSSKLEATIARQIQSQFQTSGKQALQESLKSSMENSVVPAFEMSCKAMFDQVNATFLKGMLEHTSVARQQVEATHSPLAIALRHAINSASSMTQTLTNELADGQRKLVALAVAGAHSRSGNPLLTQISNGPLDAFRDKIEAPVDPTKELSRLVYEHKYEEAFTAALQRSDVWIVSWLCSQVDLQGILTRNPLPLSQGVLLSLLQQLACDIGNDTSRKLSWMMDLVVSIKPSDTMIAIHVRPIFDQVCSILNHQMSVTTTSVSELSSLRVLIKLINSTLRSL